MFLVESPEGKIIASRTAEGKCAMECSPELDAVLSVAALLGWEVGLEQEMLSYDVAHISQISKLRHIETGVEFEIVSDGINEAQIISRATKGILSGREITKSPYTIKNLIGGMALFEKKFLTVYEVIINDFARDLGRTTSEVLEAIPDLSNMDEKSLLAAFEQKGWL